MINSVEHKRERIILIHNFLIRKGGVIQKFYEDFYEKKRNYVEKNGGFFILNFREYDG